MNETIIRKRRFFFSWQDEKQEDWLGKMSLQGLHLKEPDAFGNFLFVKGPSRKYSYRLDYNQNKPADDYIQLLRDAGWEYLGLHAGWQYWRKETTDHQVPELFTDPQSKIQKYHRLLVVFGTSSPGVAAMYIVGLAVFKRFPGRHPLWFVILFISLFIGYILFAGVNTIMILIRINKLKQKETL